MQATAGTVAWWTGGLCLPSRLCLLSALQPPSPHQPTSLRVRGTCGFLRPLLPVTKQIQATEPQTIMPRDVVESLGRENCSSEPSLASRDGKEISMKKNLGLLCNTECHKPGFDE